MKADISHLVSLVFSAVCVSPLMLSRGHLGSLPTLSCFLPICLCPTGCLIPDLLSPSASRLPSGVLTNKPLLSHLMLAFIWGYLLFHGMMDEAHWSYLPMRGCAWDFSTAFQSPSGYVGDTVANAFKYLVLTCKQNWTMFSSFTWPLRKCEMVVLWAEGWIMALGPKLGLSIDTPFLCYGGLFLGQPTHMYDRIEQTELISQEDKTNDIWVCLPVAEIKL